MKYRFLGIMISLALMSAPAIAQPGTTMAFEMRPAGGMFIPTGEMVHSFHTAALAGFQGGFELNDHAHVMLGGMWTPSKARFSTFTDKRTDIYQFDAGGELNLITPMGRDWYFRPFVGGGAGMRIYDYQAGVASKACTVGYGAVGAEAQRFAGALRFEARDNVSCFTSPVSGAKKTFNDVALSLGFVYHVK
jgi:hypothetical protein